MMDIKSVLAGLAPSLAAAIGGPFAGKAVEALEGAFGLKPGAGLDGVTDVLAAGKMTPEIVAAVRAADQRHAEIMANVGVDLEALNNAASAIDAGDRDSARKREMAVGGYTAPALAWLVVLASLVLTTGTVMGWITHDVGLQGQVGMVTGYLLNEAKTVLAYYFGSSASSARKDATIAAQSGATG